MVGWLEKLSIIKILIHPEHNHWRQGSRWMHGNHLNGAQQQQALATSPIPAATQPTHHPCHHHHHQHHHHCMIAITITVYFLQVHTSYFWDPVRKVLDLTKVSSLRSDKNMTQCIVTRQLWVWKLRQSPSPTVLTISRLFLSFQYQCKLFHHCPDYRCRSFGYWGSQALKHDYINSIIIIISSV